MKRILAATLFAATACAHAAPETETAAPETACAPPEVNSMASANDFEATLALLHTALDSRSLTTFAVIDHAKGAASIGETLRPTTVTIFGNPKGGTPLMQAQQTLALDLPLKILAYEDARGVTQLIWRDLTGIAACHGYAGDMTRIEKINGMVATIASEAAGGAAN